MNPVIASAAFGFFKAIAAQKLGIKDPHPPDLKDDVLLAPLFEEFQYRVLPFLAGVPEVGATAVPFAMIHRDRRAPAIVNSLRMLDATTGGLLYEAAYREYGAFGAFMAHALHNLGAHLPSLPAFKTRKPKWRR